VCRQRAVGLQADSSFHRCRDAVVQAPGAARLADTARVAVRVDGHPLAGAPAADVAPDASYPAGRLVSHDESAEVDLAEIGGVQVTSADAAQVNVYEHLIVAGRRHGPVLEASLAIVSEHHGQHLARSAARPTRPTGRACPARPGRRTRSGYLFSHQHFSQPLRLQNRPGAARVGEQAARAAPSTDGGLAVPVLTA
jgi:hypothetical protein